MRLRRPHIEVADIARAHSGDLKRKYALAPAQEKVLRHITLCRTEALGGHMDECDSCGFERPSYNSCRDRHCPKCQGSEQHRWVEERKKHILPIPYFHVVFTIPAELNALTLGNKRLVYDILFRAVSSTLRDIARDPKHLGAEIGFSAVLHSWGKGMQFHPHIHCIVTGGGLARDGKRWVEGHQGFLLPVKVLSELFKGRLLAAIGKAWRKGKLGFDKSTTDLAHPVPWDTFIGKLHRKKWVVYAKRPFGGPEQVYRYLGAYTHRIAISNHRIVAFDNGRVTFLYKDYQAKKGTQGGPVVKRMTLDAVEFLRRFLLHVLPKGFMRIRHYGIMAPGNVGTKLEAAKRILSPNDSPPIADARDDLLSSWFDALFVLTGADVRACPRCKKGRLVRGRDIKPATPGAFDDNCTSPDSLPFVTAWRPP
jgi:hypothetical protein